MVKQIFIKNVKIKVLYNVYNNEYKYRQTYF